MTLRRRYRIVSLVLCAVIFPATAYAKAPSNAHIRFRVPSTLSQPPIPGANDSGDIGGFVYWTGGKSRTPGVSCCKNTITNLGFPGNGGGKTTRNRFPVTMRLGGSLIQYKITSRDGRGRFVGSVITNPSPAFPDGYVSDEPEAGSSFSGSWLTTSDLRNYGGTVESSSTAGDAFTFDAFGTAVAWVAITGPNHGAAKIYVDGVYSKTISTYSKTIHRRRVVWTKLAALPLVIHTIKIVNVATPGHPRITVDAKAYLSDD